MPRAKSTMQLRIMSIMLNRLRTFLRMARVAPQLTVSPHQLTMSFRFPVSPFSCTGLPKWLKEAFGQLGAHP